MVSTRGIEWKSGVPVAAQGPQRRAFVVGGNSTRPVGAAGTGLSQADQQKAPAGIIGIPESLHLASINLDLEQNPYECLKAIALQDANFNGQQVLGELAKLQALMLELYRKNNLSTNTEGFQRGKDVYRDFTGASRELLTFRGDNPCSIIHFYNHTDRSNTATPTRFLFRAYPSESQIDVKNSASLEWNLDNRGLTIVLTDNGTSTVKHLDYLLES